MQDSASPHKIDDAATNKANNKKSGTRAKQKTSDDTGSEGEDPLPLKNDDDAPTKKKPGKMAKQKSSDDAGSKEEDGVAKKNEEDVGEESGIILFTTSYQRIPGREASDRTEEGSSDSRREGSKGRQEC